MKRVVHIENALELLKILYQDIGNGRYTGINVETIPDLTSLYAEVLISGANMLNKTGLYKEYFTHENEELTSPKGIINIGESIAQQTIFNGKLLCSYDDLSENNYFNQVVKSALQAEKDSKTLNKEIRTRAAIALKSFNGVDNIDVNKVNFNAIRYNNSNIRYKTILDIAKTIYNEEKYSQNNEYTDVDRLYCLFKKAYIKFFEKLAKEDANTITRIVQAEFDNVSLPYEKDIIGKNRLVAVSNKDRAVIIRVIKHKRESASTAREYQDNIDNMARQAIEYEQTYNIKTAALILYCNTDYKIMTCQDMKLVGSQNKMIGIDMIDLTDPWRYAVNKMKKQYKIFIKDGI